MKIMDISTEDGGTIEMVTPPKQKKLKQARLPFQILTAVDSPNSVSSKKRKLSSPSTECKNTKLIKFTTKENSIKESPNKETGVDNIHSKADNKDTEMLSDTDAQDIEEEDKDLSCTNMSRNSLTEKSHSTSNEKKTESNSDVKPGALTRFLKKTEKETEKSVKESNNVKEEEQEEEEEEKSNDKTCSAQDSNDTPSKIEKLSHSENDMDKSLKDSPSMDTSDPTNLSSDTDDPNLSSEAEDNDEQGKMSNSSDKNSKSSHNPMTPDSDKRNDFAKRRKLTPKQLERKLESAKKREEKEKLKMEKEKKREEERENRRKQKEEKRKEKEEKEKAEREQKKKEKELKEMKKQMEIEQRQKEKEAKEEERRKREEAKEEERKRKEEEKLEAERKKQKEASNFASFFVAKKQETKPAEEKTNAEQKNFMPFEVKADMRVAPVCRRVLYETEKVTLETKCREGTENTSELYLEEIKGKKSVPRKSGKTWPLEAKDDVIVIDDEEDIGSPNVVDETRNLVEKQRPKLLQFAENRRPPYWGTWRKRSSSINPRRPFAKDPKWFDYEVDSDEEWEEEEPGESLRGSDDEKDEENPEDNEYDVDNEFMVPHGYLSDEEAQADEEDGEDMSPETQKFKLKILGEEFEAERKEKTAKLKPKIIGCIWQRSQNSFPENLPRHTVEFLTARQAWAREIPVSLPSAPESAMGVECSTPTRHSVGSKKTKVPEEAHPDLVRLIHGNTHGRRFLVKEFMAYWNKKNNGHLSKASLSEKIRELAKWMACPEEGPLHRKACWYVSEETRKGILPADENIALPNRWNYVLTPKRVSDVFDVVDKPEKEEQKKSVPLITQFTKKITQEEMKRQLTTIPAPTPKPSQQKPPKRATLISVGRGEQFSKASKDTLLTKLVSPKVTNKNEREVEVINLDSDEKDDMEVVKNVEGSSVEQNVEKRNEAE